MKIAMYQERIVFRPIELEGIVSKQARRKFRRKRSCRDVCMLFATWFFFGHPPTFTRYFG